VPCNEHPLRNLRPDSLTSPGTLVVANVTKALPSSEEHKPAGSLAVIEAPPSHRPPCARSPFAAQPAAGLPAPYGTAGGDATKTETHDSGP